MVKKYVVITGGVLSGIGKGVTLSSLGFFFSENYKICTIKLDGYLNVDPGTMNPIEHGEVFVLDDGGEVDMDFGHYERFLNISCFKEQSQSMGKIFNSIRIKERRGDFLGKTVQFIPHVTNEILDKIEEISNDSQIVFVEVGGTVGDIENEIFIEAVRQLKYKVGSENIIYCHLSYVPIPSGVNEQKSKPTQQSVSMLNQKGIRPDFILCRSTEFLTQNIKEKISLFCNVEISNVLSLPDVDDVYKIPNLLYLQKFPNIVSKRLGIKMNCDKLNIWNKLLNCQKNKKICVGIAGKYTCLKDSDASILESLKHCEYHFCIDIEIVWIDTSLKLNNDLIVNLDAIIVPGGFGDRGIEGKIEVIKIARENKIPFLGICYGLQLAVIENLRNVVGFKDVSSLELGCNKKNAAITILDEQKKIKNLGGTMRLGNFNAKLKKSKILDYYKQFDLVFNKNIVKERHRHRYEVNPKYISFFEEGGLKVVGKSIERELVEFVEMKDYLHPYFVATQSHPELKSKLEKPAPLFYGLIEYALKKYTKK